MTIPGWRDKPVVRRTPAWSAAAAFVLGCGLTICGLPAAISLMPDVGWARLANLVLLCGGPQAAVLAARHVRRRRAALAVVTRSVLDRRVHGEIGALVDREDRPLRPIGMTAVDLATRTGAMLTGLTSLPGVQIFHGVRTHGADHLLVAHVVAGGRVVFLVESVAWPPGRYATDPAGRVTCDEVYIGQSVASLRAAVRYWRATLSPWHRVSAVVVVHRTGAGPDAMPADLGRDLRWIPEDDAMAELIGGLGPRPRPGIRAVAALLAATAR